MQLKEALLSKHAYPFPVESIELIETHISWVFLTGSTVYKVKKPVKYSFLDFSTLELRKKFCEKEVELNSRLCPEIYYGVIPITKENNRIVVEGRGKPIEFAVKMKQLPYNRKMDLMLERGIVAKSTIEKLAGIISDFHSKIKIIKEKRFSSPEQLREQFNDIASVRDVAEREVGRGEDIDFLIEKSNSFLEKNRSLLLERQENGFIRECHGDLHSGNIFLMEKPMVFDCVEFSEDFRYTDTASDIGFMAMDLDSFGKTGFSEKFVDSYVENSEDVRLLELLSFYKCYRANVRAKVNALRLMQELKPDNRDKTIKEVRKYLELAKGYAEML